MSRLARLGLLVARRRRAVFVICAVLVAGGAALAPVFQSQLLGVGYDTPGTESDAAAHEIAARTGFTERIALVVSSMRHQAGDPVFTRAVAQATAAVHRVDADLAVRPGTVAPDRRAVVLEIGLRGGAADRQDDAEHLQDAVDEAMPPGMEAGVTGNSPLIADLIAIEERDMLKAEVVGLPIAGLVLLAAFGSLIAAGLPLLLGLSGLMVTFGLIAGLMLFMDFNSFVESIVAMIGLGVGIDYALLIVRRFREERARHDDPADAIARTLETAGRTVLVSGAILSTSILPVAIADLPFFGDAAIGCMVVVAVMVALNLTLLPALLLALGDRIDRRRPPRPSRSGRRPGEGWNRWSRAVMRRPWPVLALGVGVLVLAALPTLGLKTGVDLNARAMTQSESVKALTALDAHVPGAALAPVEVLVTGDGPALAAATARAQAVLRGERRITAVRAEPLGRDAALVLGTPTVGVDSDAAAALVRDLRDRLAAAPPAGTRAQVTGLTAQTVDYTEETNAVTPWVIAFALLLAFGLLLTAFRSPLLALKAIVMNLLSIGAAFGLVVLVFQHGHGEGLLDFTSPGYIQSWMPLTLFMLLFGLSMDYEVFMVTRMREEWQRTGSTEDAVALGLERTGGVVTSAAAIMVAIFASFVLTSIPEMKQMGFGLAAAVLIDATIVRAALVPAFMRIAGRWNWWIPARIERLLPRLEH